ncbi:DUF4012 domain-containing protein [Nonomuraea sp. JJY05]|uniref:DUF4012 domain-containing protein n=1 Tax=Nonomuraea sp. JJY05 TaxID=3350255 RepID=UPI00373E0AB2
MQDHLEVTRHALSRLRDVVNAGDPWALAGPLSEARQSAAEAQALTATPDWALLTHVPMVGDVATVARGLAEAAAELTNVLVGIQKSASPIAVDMQSVSDMRRLLPSLETMAPRLNEARSRLARARARLAATPAATRLERVDQARATALREMDRLQGWLDAAATAATVLHPMLGGDGPRRYYLAFQTNAEARGTGGLVGAFGILEAKHGRMSIERLASNADFDDPSAPVVDLGPAYRARYGLDAARMLSISNLSPHLPHAAAIWTGMWERQTGQRLDGAIATDPVGLAYLLRAIGPVTLPGGEKVTAGNVVDLTEREAYARYQKSAARKRFLIRIALAVSEKLTNSPAEPAELLPILSRLVKERRVQIWSRRDAEQRYLSATPLGGVLPESPGPFAGLVVNNSGGNKLDYYLERSLTYELGPCHDGLRITRVRIRLDNDVPKQFLPTYVSGRLDSPHRRHAVGSNLLWVSLYASVGTKLSAAWLDGDRVPVVREDERSHPIYSKMIEFAPRQSRTLELELVEPYSAAPPQIPVQPLVRPQHTEIIQDPRGCPS